MEDIKRILKQNNFKPQSIEKLTAGSYNQVYKATLENGTYVVVRIFRSKHWPEEGKLEWISRTLDSANIASAKILFSTRKDEVFENGYMIQEFISGDIVQNEIDKRISYSDYYERLGKLINKIHDVGIKGYGYIGTGQGNHDSLESFTIRDIERFFERNEQIAESIDINFNTYSAFILDNISKISNLSSVLTHNDLSPNNIMLDSNDNLVIIDWDNAISSIWLSDFAVMTYWMRFRHKDVDTREKYIQLFLDAYQSENLSLEDIRSNEKVLHFTQALNLLGYYYLDAKDMSSYEKTLKYFYELRDTLM